MPRVAVSSCLMVLAIVLGLAVIPAAAAPPWSRLNLFQRDEFDPNQSYELTEAQGPWMILAVTFVNESAEEDALQLVYELRKKHKLAAYTHRMRFDFTGEVHGRGVSPDGGPKKMRYRRNREYDEIAVLVGDFTGIDDPEAQRTLEKIKHMWPQCLLDDEEINRPLAALREVQRRANELIGDEKQKRGPMGHAFLTTNPLLPREYFVQDGPDKFVLELNKHVEHSLLKCPGPYSVQVATFRGNVVVDPQKIAEIEKGKEFESRLDKAADMAHRLTLALRKKGWEAYEFHDRHSSIVTIGSFDSVGTPRNDGKIEINPAIHKIMETFGAAKTVSNGAPAAVGQPKVLDGIPLDVQPIPVQVPKPSIVSGRRGGFDAY